MKARMRNLLGAAAVLMAIALCAPSAHAEGSKATVRAGYLTCHVSTDGALFLALRGT